MHIIDGDALINKINDVSNSDHELWYIDLIEQMPEIISSKLFDKLEKDLITDGGAEAEWYVDKIKEFFKQELGAKL